MGRMKTPEAKATTVPVLLALGLAGRGLAVLPGVLATAAGYYLDAPAWAVLPALLLYLLPLATPKVAGTVALLLAPILLTAGLTVGSFTDTDAIAPLLLGFAATVPFFLHLGGAFPGRYLLAFLGLPALLLLLFIVVLPDPGALILTASDVRTRAQILVLLAAVALTDLGVRLLLRMRPRRAR